MKAKHVLMMFLMAGAGWVFMNLPRWLNTSPTVSVLKSVSASPEFATAETDIHTARHRKDAGQLRRLVEGYRKNKSHEARYWESYALYMLALMYDDQNQKDLSKESIMEGLAALENATTKSSEDYALLAAMRGFSIQFAGFLEVSNVATRANKEAYEAISADSTNFRGYAIAGILDMFTPPMFGGRKKAERLLTKAIDLAQASDSGVGNIHWGLDQAYGFLFKFYDEQGNKEKAASIRQTGLARFPSRGDLFVPTPKDNTQ